MSADPSDAYVLDRHDDIWRVIRGGSMVTSQVDAGFRTVGLVWLEGTAGPLVHFTADDVREALGASSHQELSHER